MLLSALYALKILARAGINPYDIALVDEHRHSYLRAGLDRGDLGNIGGDTYVIDGVTYDDGTNVSDAVRTLVRAAKIERRR